MTSATLKAAESLIKARVLSNIGADVLGVDLVERLGSWQGSEGYSIRFDFVVRWSKPWRRMDGGREYGTHQGVVHSIYGKADRADMFWGHYALTKDEAFADYVERAAKLTRRKA